MRRVRMRFLWVVILVLTVALTSAPAPAAQTSDFDRAQFNAAQQAGRPILVDIRASWCPVCAAQEPIIERLSALPEYKDLLILRVILSALSPCVLPILPVVLGTAAARHRLAPAALGAGIVLSFSAVGLFIATAGFSMGLDGGVFRA